MKVEITVTREEIQEAIQDWVKKQPLFEHVKDKHFIIGWTGGSISIIPEDLIAKTKDE